jgi:hypothetical protein
MRSVAEIWLESEFVQEVLAPLLWGQALPVQTTLKTTDEQKSHAAKVGDRS